MFSNLCFKLVVRRGNVELSNNPKLIQLVFDFHIVKCAGLFYYLCLKYRGLTKIGPGDTELDEVK